VTPEQMAASLAMEVERNRNLHAAKEAVIAQLAAAQEQERDTTELLEATVTDLRAVREQLVAREAELAEVKAERDKARWDPLEDYHKRHVPGCRKHIYDQKSSPCSCVVEWEREYVRADANERWAKESHAAKEQAEQQAAALTQELARVKEALEYATQYVRDDNPLHTCGIVSDYDDGMGEEACARCHCDKTLNRIDAALARAPQEGQDVAKCPHPSVTCARCWTTWTP
jgi:hypothetical protein